MVTGLVADLGRCKALGAVHIGTQLQALRHTCFGAAVFKSCNGGAVFARVALVALAGSVEAQAVLAAVVQLSTACFQTAVVTRPSRFAMAGT